MRWINPAERRELLAGLPDTGRSAVLVRALGGMADYDLYDVLAELGYGLAPRTRADRAEAFTYKQAPWLAGLPPKAAATIEALELFLNKEFSRQTYYPQWLHKVKPLYLAANLIREQVYWPPNLAAPAPMAWRTCSFSRFAR